MASALEQSVDDLELFVIGDGVEGPTRTYLQDLVASEDRVRFFDHPKHERRGEPHRHAALAEARGRIVCYLCDRDLMLPHHVEMLDGLLTDADFAHALIFRVTPEGGVDLKTRMDLTEPSDRLLALGPFAPEFGVPLSFAAHTLDLYRRLPHGWRTTPEGRFTDHYMWQQLLAEPTCRAVSGRRPSVLYFPSYTRQGWDVDAKAAELARWRTRMQASDAYAKLLEELLAITEAARVTDIRPLREHIRLGRRLARHPLALLPARLAYAAIRKTLGR